MKTTELYNQLKKATLKLQEAQAFPNTEPMRESVIQRYEYTFELSWKLMSSILKDQLIETYGVKNVIRESAKLGLIDNVDQWFEFALARNKASHIYLEKIAQEVYLIAKGNFLEHVRLVLDNAQPYL